MPAARLPRSAGRPRLTGTLASWNDARGFGFVEQSTGRERYFVHINAIAAIATRPRVGDQLSFVAGPGRDGRPAALEVLISGANVRQPDVDRRGRPEPTLRFGLGQVGRIILALVILALAGYASVTGRAPTTLPAVYLALAVVAIIGYFHDKYAAENDLWRIGEKILHFIDLCGGIAGGLLAQALLRHKTAKPGFAAVTYAITALHLAGLVLLLYGVFS